MKLSDKKVLARLAGLAQQSRLHGKFSARLAGLRFFHVIAKLIFNMFHRHAKIPANRASLANRASPPHVIGPLDCLLGQQVNLHTVMFTSGLFIENKHSCSL